MTETEELPRWYPPVAKDTPREVALSPMQCNILGSLCEGKSNLRIAQDWGIEIDTVKTHLKRLYELLGALDRVHAVTLVISGIVDVRRKPPSRRWPTPPVAARPRR